MIQQMAEIGNYAMAKEKIIGFTDISNTVLSISIDQGLGHTLICSDISIEIEKKWMDDGTFPNN